MTNSLGILLVWPRGGGCIESNMYDYMWVPQKGNNLNFPCTIYTYATQILNFKFVAMYMCDLDAYVWLEYDIKICAKLVNEDKKLRVLYFQFEREEKDFTLI